MGLFPVLQTHNTFDYNFNLALRIADVCYNKEVAGQKKPLGQHKLSEQSVKTKYSSHSILCRFKSVSKASKPEGFSTDCTYFNSCISQILTSIHDGSLMFLCQPFYL